MRELTMAEMEDLSGGGFLTGLACGISVVLSFWGAVSPDPFSKVMLLTHGATLIACVTAFESTGEAP